MSAIDRPSQKHLDAGGDGEAIQWAKLIDAASSSTPTTAATVAGALRLPRESVLNAHAPQVESLSQAGPILQISSERNEQTGDGEAQVLGSETEGDGRSSRSLLGRYSSKHHDDRLGRGYIPTSSDLSDTDYEDDEDEGDSSRVFGSTRLEKCLSSFVVYICPTRIQDMMFQPAQAVSINQISRKRWNGHQRRRRVLKCLATPIGQAALLVLVAVVVLAVMIFGYSALLYVTASKLHRITRLTERPSVDHTYSSSPSWSLFQAVRNRDTYESAVTQSVSSHIEVATSTSAGVIPSIPLRLLYVTPLSASKRPALLVGRNPITVVFNRAVVPLEEVESDAYDDRIEVSLTKRQRELESDLEATARTDSSHSEIRKLPPYATDGLTLKCNGLTPPGRWKWVSSYVAKYVLAKIPTSPSHGSQQKIVSAATSEELSSAALFSAPSVVEVTWPPELQCELEIDPEKFVAFDGSRLVAPSHLSEDHPTETPAAESSILLETASQVNAQPQTTPSKPNPAAGQYKFSFRTNPFQVSLIAIRSQLAHAHCGNLWNPDFDPQVLGLAAVAKRALEQQQLRDECDPSNLFGAKSNDNHQDKPAVTASEAHPNEDSHEHEEFNSLRPLKGPEVPPDASLTLLFSHPVSVDALTAVLRIYPRSTYEEFSDSHAPELSTHLLTVPIEHIRPCAASSDHIATYDLDAVVLAHKLKHSQEGESPRSAPLGSNRVTTSQCVVITPVRNKIRPNTNYVLHIPAGATLHPFAGPLSTSHKIFFSGLRPFVLPFLQRTYLSTISQPGQLKPSLSSGYSFLEADASSTDHATDGPVALSVQSDSHQLTPEQRAKVEACKRRQEIRRFLDGTSLMNTAGANIEANEAEYRPHFRNLHIWLRHSLDFEGKSSEADDDEDNEDEEAEAKHPRQALKLVAEAISIKPHVDFRLEFSNLSPCLIRLTAPNLLPNTQYTISIAAKNKVRDAFGQRLQPSSTTFRTACASSFFSGPRSSIVLYEPKQTAELQKVNSQDRGSHIPTWLQRRVRQQTKREDIEEYASDEVEHDEDSSHGSPTSQGEEIAANILPLSLDDTLVSSSRAQLRHLADFLNVHGDKPQGIHLNSTLGEVSTEDLHVPEQVSSERHQSRPRFVLPNLDDFEKEPITNVESATHLSSQTPQVATPITVTSHIDRDLFLNPLLHTEITAQAKKHADSAAATTKPRPAFKLPNLEGVENEPLEDVKQFFETFEPNLDAEEPGVDAHHSESHTSEDETPVETESGNEGSQDEGSGVETSFLSSDVKVTVSPTVVPDATHPEVHLSRSSPLIYFRRGSAHSVTAISAGNIDPVNLPLALATLASPFFSGIPMTFHERLGSVMTSTEPRLPQSPVFESTPAYLASESNKMCGKYKPGEGQPVSDLATNEISLNTTALRGSSNAFLVSVEDHSGFFAGRIRPAKRSFVVSYSRLAATTFVLGSELTVWITDASTAESVHGAIVQLFHTCGDGTLHAKFPAPKPNAKKSSKGVGAEVQSTTPSSPVAKKPPTSQGKGVPAPKDGSVEAGATSTLMMPIVTELATAITDFDGTTTFSLADLLRQIPKDCILDRSKDMKLTLATYLSRERGTEASTGKGASTTQAGAILSNSGSELNILPDFITVPPATVRQVFPILKSQNTAKLQSADAPQAQSQPSASSEGKKAAARPLAHAPGKQTSATAMSPLPSALPSGSNGKSSVTFVQVDEAIEKSTKQHDEPQPKSPLTLNLPTPPPSRLAFGAPIEINRAAPKSAEWEREFIQPSQLPVSGTDGEFHLLTDRLVYFPNHAEVIRLKGYGRLHIRAPTPEEAEKTNRHFENINSVARSQGILTHIPPPRPTQWMLPYQPDLPEAPNSKYLVLVTWPTRTTDGAATSSIKVELPSQFTKENLFEVVWSLDYGSFDILIKLPPYIVEEEVEGQVTAHLVCIDGPRESLETYRKQNSTTELLKRTSLDTKPMLPLENLAQRLRDGLLTGRASVVAQHSFYVSKTGTRKQKKNAVRVWPGFGTPETSKIAHPSLKIHFPLPVIDMSAHRLMIDVQTLFVTPQTQIPATNAVVSLSWFVSGLRASLLTAASETSSDPANASRLRSYAARLRSARLGSTSLMTNQHGQAGLYFTLAQLQRLLSVEYDTPVPALDGEVLAHRRLQYEALRGEESAENPSRVHQTLSTGIHEDAWMRHPRWRDHSISSESELRVAAAFANLHREGNDGQSYAQMQIAQAYTAEEAVSLESELITPRLSPLTLRLEARWQTDSAQVIRGTLQLPVVESLFDIAIATFPSATLDVKSDLKTDYQSLRHIIPGVPFQATAFLRSWRQGAIISDTPAITLELFRWPSDAPEALLLNDHPPTPGDSRPLIQVLRAARVRPISVCHIAELPQLRDGDDKPISGSSVHQYRRGRKTTKLFRRHRAILLAAQSQCEFTLPTMGHHLLVASLGGLYANSTSTTSFRTDGLPIHPHSVLATESGFLVPHSQSQSHSGTVHRHHVSPVALILGESEAMWRLRPLKRPPTPAFLLDTFECDFYPTREKRTMVLRKHRELEQAFAAYKSGNSNVDASVHQLPTFLGPAETDQNGINVQEKLLRFRRLQNHALTLASSASGLYGHVHLSFHNPYHSASLLVKWGQLDSVSSQGKDERTLSPSSSSRSDDEGGFIGVFGGEDPRPKRMFLRNLPAGASQNIRIPLGGECALGCVMAVALVAPEQPDRQENSFSNYTSLADNSQSRAYAIPSELPISPITDLRAPRSATKIFKIQRPPPKELLEFEVTIEPSKGMVDEQLPPQLTLVAEEDEVPMDLVLTLRDPLRPGSTVPAEVLIVGTPAPLAGAVPNPQTDSAAERKLLPGGLAYTTSSGIDVLGPYSHLQHIFPPLRTSELGRHTANSGGEKSISHDSTYAARLTPLPRWLRRRLLQAAELRRARRKLQQWVSVSASLEERTSSITTMDKAARFTRARVHADPWVIPAGYEHGYLPKIRTELDDVFVDPADDRGFGRTDEPEEIVTLMSRWHDAFADRHSAALTVLPPPLDPAQSTIGSFLNLPHAQAPASRLLSPLAASSFEKQLPYALGGTGGQASLLSLANAARTKLQSQTRSFNDVSGALNPEVNDLFEKIQGRPSSLSSVMGSADVKLFGRATRTTPHGIGGYASLASQPSTRMSAAVENMRLIPCNRRGCLWQRLWLAKRDAEIRPYSAHVKNGGNGYHLLERKPEIGADISLDRARITEALDSLQEHLDQGDRKMLEMDKKKEDEDLRISQDQVQSLDLHLRTQFLTDVFGASSWFGASGLGSMDGTLEMSPNGLDWELAPHSRGVHDHVSSHQRTSTEDYMIAQARVSAGARLGLDWSQIVRQNQVAQFSMTDLPSAYEISTRNKMKAEVDSDDPLRNSKLEKLMRTPTLFYKSIRIPAPGSSSSPSGSRNQVRVRIPPVALSAAHLYPQGVVLSAFALTSTRGAAVALAHLASNQEMEVEITGPTYVRAGDMLFIEIHVKHAANNDFVIQATVDDVFSVMDQKEAVEHLISLRDRSQIADKNRSGPIDPVVKQILTNRLLIGGNSTISTQRASEVLNTLHETGQEQTNDKETQASTKQQTLLKISTDNTRIGLENCLVITRTVRLSEFRPNAKSLKFLLPMWALVPVASSPAVTVRLWNGLNQQQPPLIEKTHFATVRSWQQAVLALVGMPLRHRGAIQHSRPSSFSEDQSGLYPSRLNRIAGSKRSGPKNTTLEHNPDTSTTKQSSSFSSNSQQPNFVGRISSLVYSKLRSVAHRMRLTEIPRWPRLPSLPVPQLLKSAERWQQTIELPSAASRTGTLRVFVGLDHLSSVLAMVHSTIANVQPHRILETNQRKEIDLSASPAQAFAASAFTETASIRHRRMQCASHWHATHTADWLNLATASLIPKMYKFGHGIRGPPQGVARNGTAFVEHLCPIPTRRDIVNQLACRTHPKYGLQTAPLLSRDKVRQYLEELESQLDDIDDSLDANGGLDKNDPCGDSALQTLLFAAQAAPDLFSHGSSGQSKDFQWRKAPNKNAVKLLQSMDQFAHAHAERSDRGETPITIDPYLIVDGLLTHAELILAGSNGFPEPLVEIWRRALMSRLVEIAEMTLYLEKNVSPGVHRGKNPTGSHSAPDEAPGQARFPDPLLLALSHLALGPRLNPPPHVLHLLRFTSLMPEVDNHRVALAAAARKYQEERAKLEAEAQREAASFAKSQLPSQPSAKPKNSTDTVAPAGPAATSAVVETAKLLGQATAAVRSIEIPLSSQLVSVRSKESPSASPSHQAEPQSIQSNQSPPPRVHSFLEMDSKVMPARNPWASISVNAFPLKARAAIVLTHVQRGILPLFAVNDLEAIISHTMDSSATTKNVTKLVDSRIEWAPWAKSLTSGSLSDVMFSFATAIRLAHDEQTSKLDSIGPYDEHLEAEDSVDDALFQTVELSDMDLASAVQKVYEAWQGQHRAHPSHSKHMRSTGLKERLSASDLPGVVDEAMLHARTVLARRRQERELDQSVKQLLQAQTQQSKEGSFEKHPGLATLPVRHAKQLRDAIYNEVSPVLYGGADILRQVWLILQHFASLIYEDGDIAYFAAPNADGSLPRPSAHDGFAAPEPLDAETQSWMVLAMTRASFPEPRLERVVAYLAGFTSSGQTLSSPLPISHLSQERAGGYQIDPTFYSPSASASSTESVVRRAARVQKSLAPKTALPIIWPWQTRRMRLSMMALMQWDSVRALPQSPAHVDVELVYSNAAADAHYFARLKEQELVVDQSAFSFPKGTDMCLVLGHPSVVMAHEIEKARYQAEHTPAVHKPAESVAAQENRPPRFVINLAPVHAVSEAGRAQRVKLEKSLLDAVKSLPRIVASDEDQNLANAYSVHAAERAVLQRTASLHQALEEHNVHHQLHVHMPGQGITGTSTFDSVIAMSANMTSHPAKSSTVELPLTTLVAAAHSDPMPWTERRLVGHSEIAKLGSMVRMQAQRDRARRKQKRRAAKQKGKTTKLSEEPLPPLDPEVTSAPTVARVTAVTDSVASAAVSVAVRFVPSGLPVSPIYRGIQVDRVLRPCSGVPPTRSDRVKRRVAIETDRETRRNARLQKTPLESRRQVEDQIPSIADSLTPSGAAWEEAVTVIPRKKSIVSKSGATNHVNLPSFFDPGALQRDLSVISQHQQETEAESSEEDSTTDNEKARGEASDAAEEEETETGGSDPSFVEIRSQVQTRTKAGPEYLEYVSLDDHPDSESTNASDNDIDDMVISRATSIDEDSHAAYELYLADLKKRQQSQAKSAASVTNKPQVLDERTRDTVGQLLDPHGFRGADGLRGEPADDTDSDLETDLVDIEPSPTFADQGEVLCMIVQLTVPNHLASVRVSVPFTGAMSLTRVVIPNDADSLLEQGGQNSLAGEGSAQSSPDKSQADLDALNTREQGVFVAPHSVPSGRTLVAVAQALSPLESAPPGQTSKQVPPSIDALHSEAMTKDAHAKHQLTDHLVKQLYSRPTVAIHGEDTATLHYAYLPAGTHQFEVRGLAIHAGTYLLPPVTAYSEAQESVRGSSGALYLRVRLPYVDEE